MDLYRIIQSIPHTWKRILRLDNLDDQLVAVENWFNRAFKGDKISRDIYWSMVESSCAFPQGSMLLWSQEFDCCFEELQWEKYCELPWKITNSTKLRLFQYQITQRCLVTNINLFYYKIKNSKSCTFCGSNTETIKHLLWDCRIIKRFWHDVFDIFKFHFSDNRLHFDTQDIAKKIILNKVVSDPKDYLNTCVLLAKRHIYVSRCSGTRPNPFTYTNLLVKHKQLEHFIAVKNNILESFEQRWKNVYLS